MQSQFSIVLVLSLRSIGVLSLLLTVCGCQEDHPPTYPVRGKVVFSDGTPVRIGVIELRSKELGINARAKLKSDGSFTLGTYDAEDGAVEGPHEAIVMQYLSPESLPPAEFSHDHEPSSSSELESEDHEAKSTHSHKAESRTSLRQGVVPIRYSDYKTSDLHFTVSSEGDNWFEVILD